ncbi:MAG: TspO/MBR family protein [Phycisphaerae bacterium]|jgi:tryptophan-rich sensory protein
MAKKERNWRALGAFAGVVAAAALIGSVGMLLTDWGWYEGLQKPPFTPASWAFGLVWPLLYATIALAGWVAWQTKPLPLTSPTMLVYAAQLLLNALWTFLFFALKSPMLAAFELTLLGLVALLNVVLFWRINRNAGLLLLPYLAWLGLAWLVNAGTWFMNHQSV